MRAPVKDAASRGAVWAWSFYDFANSPFSTSIMSVIFNVYFAKVVAEHSPLYGDTLWGILVSISTLLAGLLGPISGAMADRRGSKKSYLAICAVSGSVTTAGLFWSGPDTLFFSSILLIIANLSFSCSLSFYNSFLISLSTPASIGRVSGLGWALGYIGSGICLALNLALIQKPELFGIPTDNYFPIRLTCLICAVWWALFTIPLLLWVPEPDGSGRHETLGQTFGHAWKSVRDSIKGARTLNKNLFLCLISYLLYNDGIETVIVMAALFASQILNMSQSEIISCFLMIQFVAFFGALLFGRLGDYLGNKKALQVALTLWSVVIFWALFINSKTEFWWAGALIAIVLGGSQSLSRSLFGRLLPPGQEAQFYGFQNLSSKISATLGPLVYGISRQLTGSPRIAILSMLIFFIAGQALLSGVQEPGLKEES